MPRVPLGSKHDWTAIIGIDFDVWSLLATQLLVRTDGG